MATVVGLQLDAIDAMMALFLVGALAYGHFLIASHSRCRLGQQYGNEAAHWCAKHGKWTIFGIGQS
jgi:membrane protein DedA with SNARE-associated domain